jgi:hypothetical protein
MLDRSMSKLWAIEERLAKGATTNKAASIRRHVDYESTLQLKKKLKIAKQSIEAEKRQLQ